MEATFLVAGEVHGAVGGSHWETLIELKRCLIIQHHRWRGAVPTRYDKEVSVDKRVEKVPSVALFRFGDLTAHLPCFVFAVDSDRPLVNGLVRNAIHEHSVWVGLVSAELDRFEILLESNVGGDKGQR